MSTFDTLEQAAGGNALQQIAERVGMSPDQLQSTISSLTPSLIPKIEAGSQQGNLGNASTPEQIPAPGTDEAEDHGNSVLGSIFGSKDVSRSVAQQTADDTGVSVDKIKKVLPQLASIAAGALILRQVTHSSGGLGGLFRGGS